MKKRLDWMGIIILIGLFISFGLGYAITLNEDIMTTLLNNFTIIVYSNI